MLIVYSSQARLSTHITKFGVWSTIMLWDICHIVVNTSLTPSFCPDLVEQSCILQVVEAGQGAGNVTIMHDFYVRGTVLTLCACFVLHLWVSGSDIHDCEQSLQWHSGWSSMQGSKPVLIFSDQSLLCRGCWVHQHRYPILQSMAPVSTARQHIHHPTAHTTCSYTCMVFIITLIHMRTL